MGAARASVTAVAAVVGGVLLVTVLVTWASSIGPEGVLTGPGAHGVWVGPSDTATTPDNPREAIDPRDRLEQKYAGDRPWLRAVALVLEVLAALVVLFLLYRGARAAWERYDARRRPPPAPEEVDFDVLEQPRRVAEEIERDAGEQRRLLQEGSPRNGIVECWHRFEVQAAQAGLARHAWETSSEFTLRMLDLVGADSHDVAELAALYREARFSEHEIGEDARAAAMTALAAIHAGLGSRRPA